MFGFGKKKAAVSYDAAVQRPVLKCSICTGEQVAGFQDRQTGRVADVCLIRTPQDLAAFRAAYGIPDDVEITRIY